LIFRHVWNRVESSYFSRKQQGKISMRLICIILSSVMLFSVSGCGAAVLGAIGGAAGAVTGDKADRKDAQKDRETENRIVALAAPPKVSVYTPTGIQSGEVEIGFILYDANGDRIDVSVDYTGDGVTYFPCTPGSNPAHSGNTSLASLPTGKLHRFFWDTLADFPAGPRYVRVRVMPGGSFIGAPYRTNIFTVWNIVDRPPSAQVDKPVRGPLSHVEINYRLYDPDCEAADIVVEYSTSSVPWTSCLESGSPGSDGVANLVASPAGAGHVFLWDAPSQIGTSYANEIQIRITPSDDDGAGNSATSPIFDWGNDLPEVQVTDPAGALRGIAAVDLTLTDSASDPVTVELQFSVDLGCTWTGAALDSGSVASNIPTSPAGLPFAYNWDTTDPVGGMPGQVNDAVSLRARAVDSWGAGNWFEIGPMLVKNNEPPSATIVSIGPGDFEDLRGVVPIRFTLGDVDGGNAGVFVEWSANGSDFTAAAEHAVEAGPNPLSSGTRNLTTDGTEYLFLWSTAASGAFGNSPVTVRVTPYDDYENGTAGSALSAKPLAPVPPAPFIGQFACTAADAVEKALAGDLDNDGMLEAILFCPAASPYVTVLPGNASGVPDAAGRVDLWAGLDPRDMAVGDFNGDGICDIAIAEFGNNAILLYPGADAALPTDADALRVSPISGPYFLTVGEFGDGNADDLAILFAGVGFYLLPGGSGAFPDGADLIGFPLAGAPYDFAAADFNNDGFTDLAVTGGPADEEINYYPGGTLVPLPADRIWFTLSCSGYIPRRLAAGDFDGDGVLDLSILASGGSDTLIYFCPGKPGFSGDTATLRTINQISLSEKRKLAVADTDGNGCDELFLAIDTGSTDGISRLRAAVGPAGQLPDRLVTLAEYGAGNNILLEAASGDLDGDGVDDIVYMEDWTFAGLPPFFRYSVLRGRPGLIAAPGLGASVSFPFLNVYPFFLSNFTDGPEADLLAFDDDTPTDGYLHVGAPRAMPAAADVLETVFPIGVVDLTAADMSGDGLPDIAVAFDNMAGIFLSPPCSHPNASSFSTSGVDMIPNRIIAFPPEPGMRAGLKMLGVNGGITEVISYYSDPAQPLNAWASASQKLGPIGPPRAMTIGRFWENVSLTAAITTECGSILTYGNASMAFGNDWKTFGAPVAAAGDFNADGIDDLAVVTDDGGTIIFIHGNNGARPTTPVTSTAAVTADPLAFAVGDPNMDGIDDLVAVLSDGTAVFVPGQNGSYPGDGDVVQFAAGADFTRVEIADFTADGVDDVVLSASNEGELRFYAGSPGNAPGIVMQATVPVISGADLLAAGDFNGDGITDVAVTCDGSVFFVPGRPGRFAHAFEVTFANGLGGIIDLIAGDFAGDARTDLALLAISPDRLVVLPNLAGGETARMLVLAASGVSAKITVPGAAVSIFLPAGAVTEDTDAHVYVADPVQSSISAFRRRSVPLPGPPSSAAYRPASPAVAIAPGALAFEPGNTAIITLPLMKGLDDATVLAAILGGKFAVARFEPEYNGGRGRTVIISGGIMASAAKRTVTFDTSRLGVFQVVINLGP